MKDKPIRLTKAELKAFFFDKAAVRMFTVAAAMFCLGANLWMYRLLP